MDEKYRHILLPLDAIHPHMDWVEDYMSHMESSRRKMYVHDQWKTTKQANFQEKLLRHISCTRWPLWRKSTHLDVCFHPLTNGRELIHWMCSHGSFAWSVIPFPC